MSRNRQTKYIDRVWELSAHTAAEKFALLAIAEHANDKGVARPSFKRLAQLLGVGERYVVTLVAALEKSGELHIHRRTGKFNVYIIAVGMSDDEIAVAKTYVENVYSQQTKSSKTTDLLITSTHDPLISSLFTRANQITTAQEISSRNKTTDPVIMGHVETTDLLITRTKDSVVGGNEESDIPEHQQQGAPARAPVPAERALFEQHHVGEAIWRSWMRHDPAFVIAAVLHATLSNGVQNPIGLMRAMLEQGTAAPGAGFLAAAREQLGTSALDVDALEAAGWDPRLVGANGNGHEGVI